MSEKEVMVLRGELEKVRRENGEIKEENDRLVNELYDKKYNSSAVVNVKTH